MDLGFSNTLLSYQVTPEEIGDAYRKKHIHNIQRNYSQEYEEKYNG